jgi:hypothetical protein
MRYIDFTVNDFAMDEYFQSWVFNSGDESIRNSGNHGFWSTRKNEERLPRRKNWWNPSGIQNMNFLEMR